MDLEFWSVFLGLCGEVMYVMVEGSGRRKVVISQHREGEGEMGGSQK